jgi:hypothetical protein
MMAEEADPFSGDRYRVRGKLSFQGRLFQVENEAGERVLFAEHPFLQTERELILYADEKLLLPLIAVVERGQSSLRRTLDVFDVRASTPASASCMAPLSPRSPAAATYLAPMMAWPAASSARRGGDAIASSTQNVPQANPIRLRDTSSALLAVTADRSGLTTSRQLLRSMSSTRCGPAAGHPCHGITDRRGHPQFSANHSEATEKRRTHFVPPLQVPEQTNRPRPSSAQEHPVPGIG